MAFNNLIDLDRLERFLGKLKLYINDEIGDVTELAEDIVIISDSQPSSENNKLWVKDDVDDVVQIPTYAELQAVASQVDDKVDKITGKGLSTEDYTTSEKAKLADIAAGAEVNVQPDWNQTTDTADNFIKNKPANLVQDASYVHTDNNYTTEEKTKLSGIATGAEVNVQSDWNQSDNTKDDFIKNKPTLGTAAAKNVGVANGVAELDENGHVPTSQLPSYVDDVVEGYYYNGSFYQNEQHTTGYIPEDGKIYVDIPTNKSYRWGGSVYVVVASDLALGSTSSTAFRGDYGAAAYAHAVTNKGASFADGLYKITTNGEGHVTAATPVAKSDITGLGIPGSDTTYSNATTSSNGLMSSADKAKLDSLSTFADITLTLVGTV